jgi:SAM-dependent methyltransferase
MARLNGKFIKTEKHPVIFKPKLWEQRRTAILNFINNKKMQVIMDLGCNEGKIIKFLTPFNENVEYSKLIGVDSNLDNLKVCSNLCKPCISDQSILRPAPLDIDLYVGNCTQYATNLPKVDFIIFSEIIQHYKPEELDQINKVIFGGYRPQYVIVSTPNSEFNVLFDNTNWNKEGQKFRDERHKFEWTRKEFSQWCETVSSIYGYTHDIDGVGTTQKSQSSDLGFCTQLAKFKLNPNYNNNYPTPDNGIYVKHASIGYPHYKEDITIEEKHKALLNLLRVLHTSDKKYSIDAVWSIFKIKQMFTYKSKFVNYLYDCKDLKVEESKLYLVKK